jgi:DNA-binding beta-propeller fold protein YncE
MTHKILFIIAFFTIRIDTNAQQLVELWATDAVFDTPESVLFDKKNHCLYVTNIGGKEPWKKDENGFISKLTPDGKILEREWVTGFNAPKGMAIFKDKLYVADVDQVVVVDIKNGKVERKLDCKGSSSLNDVSTGKGGNILISDSGGRALYNLHNGTFTKLVDSTSLTKPNGVLYTQGQTYLLDKNGINKVANGQVEMLVNGMPGGTDGIEQLSKNEFIVSCWSGTIYYVNTKLKTKKLLLDTSEKKINTADIGLDSSTKTVFVPTFFDNRVIAYKFKM